MVAIAAAHRGLDDRRLAGGEQRRGDAGEPLPDVGWRSLAALGVALACAGCGTACWSPRVGMQPIIATLILMVAGRGIAQLITGGQIITIYYAPFFFIGSGYLLGPAVLGVHRGARCSRCCTWRSRARALGLFIQAVGINPARGARGRRAGAPHHGVGAYAFCGLRAGVAGLLISSNVKSADGNNAGQLLELDAILAVTLGGTAAHGRALQPGGQRDRRADHPDPDLRHLLAGRAAGDQPGGEGGGGVRR